MLVINAKPILIDYNLEKISKIEEKLKEGQAITESETFNLLEYACGKTRDLLSESDDELYENKDYYAASIIYNYLKELNIEVIPNNTSSIDYGVKPNYFLIVKIRTDMFNANRFDICYLVDPTFIQFLTSEKCNNKNQKSKDGIIYQKPDVGYYIHPRDKMYLSKLIERGYTYFGTELASIYGNAFANTKVPTDNERLISEFGYKYYDKFTKGDKTKLIDKDELSDIGLSITPVKNKQYILN